VGKFFLVSDLFRTFAPAKGAERYLLSNKIVTDSMINGQHQVIVSLASNEQQERHMKAARELLDALLEDTCYTNAIWTEPVNSHRKTPYLNQLCKAVTHLEASTLDEALKDVERRLGRTHHEDGIVAIDLDILLYDDHRMHLRDWDRDYVKKLIVEI